MTVQELIGKRITNVYFTGKVKDGLDFGECFVELDNALVVDIPIDIESEVWIKPLNPNAQSLFSDLSDYPVYHVNKTGKTIAEAATIHKQRRTKFFNRLKFALFGVEPTFKEYVPYKTEFRENELKHVKDRTIVDVMGFEDESEKVFLELDNGYLISETTVSPNGTGLTGLNYFRSINDLWSEKETTTSD